MRVMSVTPNNSAMIDAWRHQSNALRWQGGLIVLLGLISIVLPVISTLALAIVLGAILVVAGVAEGIRAVRAWGQAGAGTALILAVIAAIAGIVMLVNPFAGALSLARVISAYMNLSGVAKARFARAVRPHAGWGWMAFSAALSLILGIIVLIGLPMTAFWVPGTLLGIELLFFGAALFMLASALRKAI
jgi:uncharacterized membrane protein HdeD (DUF308 family)